MTDDRNQQDILGGDVVAATRDVHRRRLNAALVDAARAIRAAHDRSEAPSPGATALLERCGTLLHGARRAAGAGSRLVAYDCLYQIERELVATMDESERRATLAVYLAENNRALAGWQRDAALALARLNDEVPSVAALRALMRTVHAARQDQQYRVELARRQIGALAGLLIAAVVFFSAWALAGGFEWILNEDVEVTLAMMLVNGVLFGFLGGILSVVFSLLRPAANVHATELRGGWASTIVRPFIGATVAIPIVLLLQSGLLNLGNVMPTFDLALCFIGGFTERWFAAQVDRIAGKAGG